MDEIDAFPFNGSDLLYSMFERSVKGNSVLMSATPSENVLKTYRNPGKMILELNIRYHKHALPIPKLIVAESDDKFDSLKKNLDLFLKQNKPVLIFVPTIDKCEEVYNQLKQSFNGGYFVHSKHEKRPRIISDFKHGEYRYLVTTAVLERGVTIRNLQVIVYDADDSLYDEHALIQIAGRVGRKADAPDGEVIFIGETITESMEKARNTIVSKNEFL